MMGRLSPSQSAALFDILTHHNTYDEIRDFRWPGRLDQYGPPFILKSSRPSTSPALQGLVSRFVLTLPGLRDVSDDFWKVQCYDVLENLVKSNLSESYDKGIIGSRKTLATAISALIEYPVRGIYAGFPRVCDREPDYDTTKGEDLFRAFRDFINDTIYGTAIEDLIEKTAQTDNLDDHEPLTKAVHEFVLVKSLASLMHYTLILSPKGQYLLKLIDNANKLVPYKLLKQTLKIGNVASMISGMVKIALAKVSVASVTNWMGLTQNPDEGMNLMQQIISTVLSLDIKDLESRAAKLERERAKMGKEQLHALKDYTNKPQAEQDRIRIESERHSISIVTAILRDAKMESRLTGPHHEHALDYLSIQLSIRDRKQIIQVLCRSTPDYLTLSVREVVDAYEPVIRRLHNAIDLSGTLSDFEIFLKDLIKLAKIPSGKDRNVVVPTVGDFVQLLRKHQHGPHVFVHQCCKNDQELTSWYLDWAKTAASHFKRDTNVTAIPQPAGDLTESLNDMFLGLPTETQERILPVLDAYFTSLEEMHSGSIARLTAVLRSPPSKNPVIAKILSPSSSRPNSRPLSPAPSPTLDKLANGFQEHAPTPAVSSDPGPGAYLARWQDLLDTTPITPLTQEAEVSAADGDEGLIYLAEIEARGGEIRVRKKPDVRIVMESMGEDFRRLLAERSCYW